MMCCDKSISEKLAFYISPSDSNEIPAPSVYRSIDKRYCYTIPRYNDCNL